MGKNTFKINNSSYFQFFENKKKKVKNFLYKIVIDSRKTHFLQAQKRY